MAFRKSYTNYGTEAYPRPHDDIDPKVKMQPKWMLDWCKYIFGYGARSEFNSPYSRYDLIERNREYADGRQDPEQYLSRFYDEVSSRTGHPVGETDNQIGNNSFGGQSQLREGYLNVKKDILQVFPKYLSWLLGKYASLDHDVTAEARDLKSGAERQNMKWDRWYESTQRDFLDSFYASFSDQEAPKPDFIPETIEELELFESMGGFKLKYETALETIIGHSFDISNLDNTIKRKLIYDFICCNMAASQDYFDISDKKVKLRYLDIANLIIPWDVEDEYQNPEFYGYVRLYKASELRMHGFAEEKIRTFARQVAGYYGNHSWNYVERYESSQQGVHDNYAYNDYLIPVLECEWESVDTFYDTYRMNKEGQRLIHEENFEVGQERYDNDKFQNRKDRRIDKTNIKNRYQCKWVIDSDEIFSYGRTQDTIRKNNNVRSSIHVFRLQGSSMVERCKETLDQIQILWLKFQNAVAIAAPPGIAIEYDALTNISTGQGNQMFHPLQVLKIKSQTGNLIYKLTPMGFGLNPQSRSNAGKPFEELQGGMRGALAEFAEAFQTQISVIQQNTGINSVADASNPDPQQSVSGSEMAIAATNYVLRPLYNGYMDIKKHAAENMTNRIQMLVGDDPEVYKAYYPVLGKDLQTLKIAGKMAACDMGIHMEARPTEKMKADISEQIKIGMQVGKNGNASLNSSQGIMLLNMLENGTSLKLAYSMLSYYEKKSEEQRAQRESENIKQQGEEKRLNDQAKAQLDQAMESHKSKLKQDEIRVKEEETRKTNLAKHIQEMERLAQVEKLRISDNSGINQSI